MPRQIRTTLEMSDDAKAAKKQRRKQLKRRFEAAVAAVQGSADAGLSQATQLKFYALYKQATQGPCREEAPSRLRMVARAKWYVGGAVCGSRLSCKPRSLRVLQIGVDLPAMRTR